MKFNVNALVGAAMALATAGSAHANWAFGNPTTNGNGSVAFVAIDNGGNVSLGVDLGVQMASFLNIAGQTAAAGSLTAAGTRAVWNFANNTYTVNGTAVNTFNFNWSPVATFLANANVTSGGYQWGVISSDTVSSTTLSASNVIRGQGVLYTGTPDFDVSGNGTTSGSINNSTGNTVEWMANNNNTGTHSTTVKGASIQNVGSVAFLGTALAQNNVGDFGGGQFGNNNFLVDPGATSYFNWAQAAPTANIWSIGAATVNGSLSASASTFSWNAANSTLTYVVPVPEPGTYALMLAGLAGVGFMARRRAAR